MVWGQPSVFSSFVALCVNRDWSEMAKNLSHESSQACTCSLAYSGPAREPTLGRISHPSSLSFTRSSFPLLRYLYPSLVLSVQVLYGLANQKNAIVFPSPNMSNYIIYRTTTLDPLKSDAYIFSRSTNSYNQCRQRRSQIQTRCYTSRDWRCKHTSPNTSMLNIDKAVDHRVSILSA
jgi:hypothetical protein